MNTVPTWLRLDEYTNSLDFLEHSLLSLKQTENDIVAWKWVMISLHGALYGFAICACKGIDDHSVVQTTKKGKQKLIGFDEALKRCQSKFGALAGQPLTLENGQRKSIEYLKELFRDNFEHYIPQGWSIEAHSFPCLSVNVLSVIDFLALRTPVLSHFKDQEEARLRGAIKDISDFLERCLLHKELREAKKCYCALVRKEPL